MTETGKPSASDWTTNHPSPRDRERDRILQIIDRYYVEEDALGMRRTCEVLEAIIREMLEPARREPWDEMWEPNYWDSSL